MNFGIKFDVNNAIESLKKGWNSNLDIKINTWRNKNPLIFSVDDDSYSKDGKFFFSGYRILIKANDNQNTKKFNKFIKKYEGMIVSLDDAIEFITDFYNKKLHT